MRPQRLDKMAKKESNKYATEKIDIDSFILNLLGIENDFAVTKVVKSESDKTIEIHLKYRHSRYKKDNQEYPIYDKAPEREWQHLNWFEYKCLIKCSLPRYIKEGKVITADVEFAPKKNTIL